MSAIIGITIEMGELPQSIVDGSVYRALVYPAIEEGIEFLRGQLALNTPSGATGLARQAVVTEITEDGENIIGHADYAEPPGSYIHYPDQGTRPHWPPYEPIAYWVMRVLGTTDEGAIFAVRRAIAFSGNRPQKFVERTATENALEAAAIVSDALDRSAARLA